MTQFDVFRIPAGDLVLDCQSDLLGNYNSRFVVPLLPLAGGSPAISRRLNPVFIVSNEQVVMMTEFATSLPTRELKLRIVSLRSETYTITMALDYLVGGY